MKISQSSESLVFDFRTLRVLIGAIAIAFPAVVYVLTGKITTSISASYHEAQTHDVFVGFLFILGALLVSYKGHRLWVSFEEGSRLWVWIKRHQEDVISTLGGFAAIAAALFPTACDDCSFDTRARIHTIGAFILFFNVAYFSLIAFLRSLNLKLKRHDEFAAIQHPQEQENRNPVRRFLHYFIAEILLFGKIVREASRRYDEEHQAQRARQGKPSVSYTLEKFAYLRKAYRQKIRRGFIYVICGSLITLILLVFVPTSLVLPKLVAASKMTFLVEAFALWLFGAAWLTAAHIPFFRKIWLLWVLRRQKRALVAEPGPA